jgi:hypothetical protein
VCVFLCIAIFQKRAVPFFEGFPFHLTDERFLHFQLRQDTARSGLFHPSFGGKLRGSTQDEAAAGYRSPQSIP